MNNTFSDFSSIIKKDFYVRLDHWSSFYRVNHTDKEGYLYLNITNELKKWSVNSEILRKHGIILYFVRDHNLITQLTLGMSETECSVIDHTDVVKELKYITSHCL